MKPTPAPSVTVESISEGDFTIGAGAEKSITKGLVARLGIYDTISSDKTTYIDKTEDKSGSSAIWVTQFGLGYSFNDYQVDLVVPVYSSYNSETPLKKTSQSERAIRLGVSAKF